MIVKFHQVSAESALEYMSFDEGTLYFAEDTHRIFLDPVGGSSRIELTDIEIFEDHPSITYLMSPVPGKVYLSYFDSDAHTLVLSVYKDGIWYHSNTHNILSSKISGTFGGTVIANQDTNGQPHNQSCLRNSRLFSGTGNTPTVNGEIYWHYE